MFPGVFIQRVGQFSGPFTFFFLFWPEAKIKLDMTTVLSISDEYLSSMGLLDLFSSELINLPFCTDGAISVVCEYLTATVGLMC